MLETELYTECVLAGKSVRISETFGVSATVMSESEHVLSLEINTGTAHVEFRAYFFRKRVAKR